jgi:predicted Ser/Thr protein kinase
MPKRVGSFVIRRRLAQGGMGVVYLGWQPALERHVIIKKLRPDLARDRDAVERFQREARIAAAIHHQNVVAVYDCFEADGERYIAQEHVSGQDLETLLSRGGPMPARTAGLIALDLIRALEAIHACGVVHRDLKPANVLVSPKGEVKLVDFGIAHRDTADRLTRPGTAIGSLPYMAPEQMQGEAGDARSDLYALGALLYELLTGRFPFPPNDDDDTASMLERIRRGRFASPRTLRPGTPRFLCRLIRRCLRARPSRRPASAAVLRRRLERWLSHPDPPRAAEEIAADLWHRGLFAGPMEATTPRAGAAARVGSRLRRRLLPAAVIAALALAVPGSLLVWTQLSAEAPASGAGPTPLPYAPAPPAAPAPDPSRLLLGVPPWVEVRIGGGEPVLLPRDLPLPVPPGVHELELRYPGGGTVHRRVELAPGQLRFVPGAAPDRTVSQAAPEARRSPLTDTTS